MDNSLRKVCNSSQCEKACEEISGTGIWTEEPKSFRISERHNFSMSRKTLKQISRCHVPGQPAILGDEQ